MELVYLLCTQEMGFCLKESIAVLFKHNNFRLLSHIESDQICDCPGCIAVHGEPLFYEHILGSSSLQTPLLPPLWRVYKTLIRKVVLEMEFRVEEGSREVDGQEAHEDEQYFRLDVTFVREIARDYPVWREERAKHNPEGHSEYPRDSKAVAACIGRFSQTALENLGNSFGFSQEGLERYIARIPCNLECEDLHRLDAYHAEATK